MSGETEGSPSGLTTDTLRLLLSTEVTNLKAALNSEVEHVKELMAEADKRFEQRFLAQEEATKYARQVTNEFRGTLSDQASLFMPRAESEARATTNADKIDALATRLERIEGQTKGALNQQTERRSQAAAVQANLGTIIAVIVALMMAIGLIASLATRT